jgi:hypothetical protein
MKKCIYFIIGSLMFFNAYSQTADTSSVKYDTTVVKLVKDKKAGMQVLQLKEDLMVLKDSTGRDSVLLKVYKKNQAGAGKTVVIELQDKSKKISCVNEMDMVVARYADGSSLDLYQNGMYNCKGISEMHFGGNWGWEQQIKKLSEKKISGLRMFGSGGNFVDVKLTKKQSEDLQKAIKSILEYTF